LTAKFLSAKYTNIEARPTDQAELDLANTRAPGKTLARLIITELTSLSGFGVNQSVYEVRLYDAVTLLRKWCIVYLTTASRCGSGMSS